MSYIPFDDSAYKNGTLVYAKAAPSQILTVMSYYRRIYYCMINKEPHKKFLAYFEGEIVPLS